MTAASDTDLFHFQQRLGFRVGGPVAGYNGPGRAVVAFTRELGSSPGGDPSLGMSSRIGPTVLT